jgi:muramoyltetrapeptide carboxypeptidase
MTSRRKFLRAAGLVTSLSLIDLKASAASFELSSKSKAKIKAPKLKTGDTVVITSPAGAVWDEQQIGIFSDILKSFGLKVIYGETLKRRYGYFSGTDEERAKELNDLFANKSVKGIFCMKGGWGCARILDKLNYDTIAQNPKVLIGFSDITSLLVSIYMKTGLITFHGPVGNSGWNEFTSKIFREVVMASEPIEFPVGPAPEDKPVTINKGIAEGTLVGGNLTVLSCMVGSSYLPDWKGKILFLEEWKEEPYSIDRMFTQMKLAGILDALGGIVFGKCVKCEAEEPQKAFTFMEVLEQHIKPLGIPAFYGAQIGHIENKLTLPVGADVIMNADAGTIKLKESGVV